VRDGRDDGRYRRAERLHVCGCWLLMSVCRFLDLRRSNVDAAMRLGIECLGASQEAC
jgi:hypothetical protein